MNLPATENTGLISLGNFFGLPCFSDPISCLPPSPREGICAKYSFSAFTMTALTPFASYFGIIPGVVTALAAGILRHNEYTYCFNEFMQSNHTQALFINGGIKLLNPVVFEAFQPPPVRLTIINVDLEPNAFNAIALDPSIIEEARNRIIQQSGRTFTDRLVKSAWSILTIMLALGEQYQMNELYALKADKLQGNSTITKEEL